MNETETERKRERGGFLFICCSVINLSPIPGLKVASAETEIMYYVWRYQC